MPKKDLLWLMGRKFKCPKSRFLGTCVSIKLTMKKLRPKILISGQIKLLHMQVNFGIKCLNKKNKNIMVLIKMKISFSWRKNKNSLTSMVSFLQVKTKINKSKRNQRKHWKNLFINQLLIKKRNRNRNYKRIIFGSKAYRWKFRKSWADIIYLKRH